MTRGARCVGVVLALLLGTLPARSAETIDASAKIARLRETSRELSKLARDPLPARLTPGEQHEALAQRRWLEEASRSCNDLAGRWERALGPNRTSTPRTAPARPGAPPSKREQEMNTSFNLQLMQLQNRLQRENHDFTITSNVLKAKRDTAKAAIENVR